MESLFTAPSKPVRPLDAFYWWEQRRIPYNVIIGGVGVVSFIIFIIGLYAVIDLEPGEDAFEPVALFFAPILINLGYTAGWLVDVPLRIILPSLSPQFTLNLFRLGLGFSLFVVSFPGIYWGGRLLLKITGLL